MKRAIAMKSVLLCVIAVQHLTGSVISAADLVLADRNKSKYQIIVPDVLPTNSLDESLRQTGRLMQTAFQANDFKVDVATESKRDTSRPGIYLGNTAFARGHGVDLKNLTSWGYDEECQARGA